MKRQQNHASVKRQQKQNAHKSKDSRSVKKKEEKNVRGKIVDIPKIIKNPNNRYGYDVYNKFTAAVKLIYFHAVSCE